MTVADIRQSYEKYELLESALAADPFEQFTLWFNDALAAKVAEPNAMTLATTTLAGRPSARIVLLKGFDAQGFVFYTNYLSRKGHELAENPYASLLFFWPALERQARIEGTIGKVSPAESDEYFHSRPLGSRIGAWVSPQSQPMPREGRAARTGEWPESLGNEPPRPEHWGGCRSDPHRVEFWQGRPSRLHGGLVFQRDADQAWSRVRL